MASSGDYRSSRLCVPVYGEFSTLGFLLGLSKMARRPDITRTQKRDPALENYAYMIAVRRHGNKLATFMRYYCSLNPKPYKP